MKRVVGNMFGFEIRPEGDGYWVQLLTRDGNKFRPLERGEAFPADLLSDLESVVDSARLAVYALSKSGDTGMVGKVRE